MNRNTNGLITLANDERSYNIQLKGAKASVQSRKEKAYCSRITELVTINACAASILLSCGGVLSNLNHEQNTELAQLLSRAERLNRQIERMTIEA